MNLQDAIKMVKDAGYTVRKVAQRRKSSLTTVGPTFVAVWHDGEFTNTRMSIHCADDALDVKRAARVSHAAYQSRFKGARNCTILDGHFERNGEVLAAYPNMEISQYLN